MHWIVLKKTAADPTGLVALEAWRGKNIQLLGDRGKNLNLLHGVHGE
jgi:hypothetical protein